MLLLLLTLGGFFLLLSFDIHKEGVLRSARLIGEGGETLLTALASEMYIFFSLLDVWGWGKTL